MVAALPRARASPLPLLRYAPSRRSLLAGLGLLALAAGVYVVARESSAFAVRRVEVDGVPPAIQRDVREAVASLRGASMLALDGTALVRRVDALPSVRSASYDRAFPHTLRIHVVPETPAAVLHRGKETWLVSARGRVISRIPNLTFGALARVWVPRATPVSPGAFLPADAGGVAARSLALALRFPARIATASLVRGQLVFRLRSGLAVELGDPTDLRLKLAIARRALAALPPGATYVDVSVPGRPVAGTNPQLSGGG